MGIKFKCPACSKKINVKTYLAGKKGICPYCNAKVDIPAQSDPGRANDPDEGLEGHGAPPAGPGVSVSAPAGSAPPPSDALADAPTTITKMPDQDEQAEQPDQPLMPPSRKSGVASAEEAAAVAPQAAAPAAAAAPAPASVPAGAPGVSDPFSDAPDATWYLRLASGDQYGPAKAPEMKQWLDENRVTPDSLVWRDDWPDWKRADATFPRFAGPRPGAPGPMPGAVPGAPMGAPQGAPMGAPMQAAPMAGAPMGAMPMGGPQMAPGGFPGAAPMAAAPMGAPMGAPAAAAYSPFAAAAPGQEQSADTMELLSQVGSDSGYDGGGGGGGGGEYYPPPRSNAGTLAVVIGGSILLLVLVVVLFFALVNQPAGGGLGGSQMGTGTPGYWEAFQSRGENFEIKMPKKPVSKANTENTSAGQLQVNQYFVDDRGGSGYLFSISVARITDAAAATSRPAEFYKDSADYAAKSVPGLSPPSGGTPITYGSYSGQEYMIRGGGGAMKARIYIINGRRYVLSVFDPNGRGLNTEPVNQFFRNFKITK